MTSDGWARPDPQEGALLLKSVQRWFLPVTLLGYPMGTLILRWASHLDAFSGYPLRTWLPSVYRWHDNWYTRGAFLPVLSY